MTITGSPTIQGNKARVAASQQIDIVPVAELPSKWKLKIIGSSASSSNVFNAGIQVGGSAYLYIYGASYNGAIQLRGQQSGDSARINASGYGSNNVQNVWEVLFDNWTYTLFFNGINKGSWTMPTYDRQFYTGKTFGLWFGGGSGVNDFDYVELLDLT